MTGRVSREDAEDVLDAIKRRWPAQEWGLRGPNLRDHTHEELPRGCWSIDWEDGPQDWALHPFETTVDWPTYDLMVQVGMSREDARRSATMAGVEQPHPDTVFCEPIRSFVLGLYPAEDQ